jgi:hypothetical protein
MLLRGEGMTLIREIGIYKIESKKVDSLDPWWADWSGIIAVVILVFGFASIFLTFGGANNGLVVNGGAGTNLALFFSLLVINLFLIAFFAWWLPDKFKKCGISITLQHTKEMWYMEKSFQLSGNAEADAVKAKTIVDALEVEAKRLVSEKIEKDKKQEEEEKVRLKKKEECCNLYKDVIDKVK